MEGGAGQPFFAAARYVLDPKDGLPDNKRRVWEAAAKQGVPLWLVRPAAADHNHTNLATVKREWSFRDVFEAHLVCDAFDALRQIERDEAPRR